jgi:hypothetical protein
VIEPSILVGFRGLTHLCGVSSQPADRSGHRAATSKDDAIVGSGSPLSRAAARHFNCMRVERLAFI